MILLLDTNVLSVLASPTRDRAVMQWFYRQHAATLYTCAVCQAELWSGIAIMPDGQRRHALEQAAHAMFAEDFGGHILPFDAAAAEAYAGLFAARRRQGLGTPMSDLMIAAIAHVHDAFVVTRNVRDFEGCGITVINPWDA